MESSADSDLPEVVESRPLGEMDRLAYLEARVGALEDRVPSTQLLNRRFLPRAFAVLGHYLAAGLIVYLLVLAVVLSVALVSSGFGGISDLFDRGNSYEGEAVVPEGPRLRSVTSLPVNASGVGTLRGSPTGEATCDERDGKFVLVLDPAPSGLPDRTTLDVAFDRSTKVYGDGELLGDPLTAMNSDEAPGDADPTAAGSVVVTFRIKNGAVFADRIDLSEEFSGEWDD